MFLDVPSRLLMPQYDFGFNKMQTNYALRNPAFTHQLKDTLTQNVKFIKETSANKEGKLINNPEQKQERN